MAKNIHIQKVKELANKMLASEHLTDDNREGVRMLLESLLFETDNYNGFGYVDWLDNDGFEKWKLDSEKAGFNRETLPYLGNQTKRIYF